MVPSQKDWPDWWQWELDCSNPHLAKRMNDRSFSEIDLRVMLERANAFRVDARSGRWVVETSHAGGKWEVVVEPDANLRLLVIVTAYAVG